MEKLNEENVSLAFQVGFLIKERESVKLEYQKLFNSIKTTRAQHQREVNKLIENVNQKTYAYGDVRSKNQDLLMTIYELKTKLKTAEKEKNADTKFDKSSALENLVHVTQMNKNKNQKSKVVPKINVKQNLSKPDTLCSSPNLEQVKSNTNVIARGMYRVKTTGTQSSLVKTKMISFNSIGVGESSSISRPKSKSSKLKKSVLLNTKSKSTSREFKKKQSYVSHVSNKSDTSNSHDGSNFVVQLVLWIVDSGCSKHMTGNLKLLKNFVEKFMGSVYFGNDHFAATTRYGDYIQGEDLLTGSCDSNLYTISISEMAVASPVDDLGKLKPKAGIGIFIRYSESSRGYRIYNCGTRKIMETIHVNFDELTAMASECNNLEPGQNRSNFQDSSEESIQTSSKEDSGNLFGPLYEEYTEMRTPEVSTNSAAPNTLNNEDTPSSSSIIVDKNEAPQIVSTSKEPTSLVTNDIVNESIQEDIAKLDGNTFINPFCSPVLEEAKSSLTNQDPSNMHEFYRQYHSTDKWTKNYPPEQVIGDPSKLVMIKSRLNTDAEICMYALTMSTTEPNNIKEAMLVHSWIESMQYEIHHFHILNVWELIERPVGRNIIGVKWLWKDKTDAKNMVIRNKFHLITKCYRQEERIDFEESFAPVA
ncbi:integrase, catalytic region, zinc finger, CCHC-type containing protein [Tanacetum coccineum]